MAADDESMLLEDGVDSPEEHLETLELPSLCLDVYMDASLRSNPAWGKLVDELIPLVRRTWPVYLEVALSEEIPQSLGLKTSVDGLECQTWEIDLNFVSNEAIRALNAEYRGKDQPTDVLTFTLLADSPSREHLTALPVVQLGSIFVSLEWAKEAVNSMENNGNLSNSHVLNHYILERVIHGFLHLMGVNHDTMREYNRVVGLQKRVLDEVFGSGTRSS